MTPARRRALFVAILALALVPRLLALMPFSTHHPDEIFQYLEPAHRIAFGPGVVTWEFRNSMRGWLLPTLLSWPMMLGGMLAPGSALYLLLPRLTVSLLSLSIPVAAFVIGLRQSRTHAFVAMAVMSLWFEGIYFSAHTLSEEFSVALFMPAAALMLADSPRAARNHAVAGLLLGFAVAMRFHYAPAIFVFCAMTCGRDVHRRWLPLAAGGAVALALSGVADLAHGAMPFSWIAHNFEQNVVHDQAAKFGLEGPLFYLGAIGGYWRWMGPLLLIAIRPAIGRHRALFATALVNIALLSLIGHKEYRFILLSTTILLLLAALGSVDLLQAWRRRRAGRSSRPAWVALGLLWLVGSVSLAASLPMAERWTQNAPQLTLMSEAGRLPQLCGLALDRQVFWLTGGYTYLHRDVPLYLTYPTASDHIAADDMYAAARSFDALITPAATTHTMPAAFRRIDCRGDDGDRMCLMVRPGGCTASAAAHWEMEVALRRNGL